MGESVDGVAGPYLALGLLIGPQRGPATNHKSLFGCGSGYGE